VVFFDSFAGIGQLEFSLRVRFLADFAEDHVRERGLGADDYFRP
jgi:hypothetical protein